ncbi:MAG: glycosyltransferase family 4 protein [Rhodospirillales bacterium]|nr:glycosyltransferase family 4 protein [Rhodospirillales bacterium]MCB9995137.1 glycosyltransferase family 4 protein [Rhodospirillales bacterium]
MKVFHIKSTDTSAEATRRFADLVLSLAELGIRQYVVMDANEIIEARFQEAGIPFSVQKFSGLFDLRTQQAAQQIAESFGPHIIQTHSPDSATISAKIRFNAVRVCFAEDDPEQHKKVAGASDIVLSVSYPQQGAPLDYDILPVPPLVKGCGNNAPDQPAAGNVIGTVADLVPGNHINTVFKALRDIPQTRFHILGDGPEKQALLTKAQKQAIHDRIDLIDTQTTPRDFFKNLDLCVVPFREAGIDRVTLESWSCGCCVLSAMPPERSPITDEEDGILIGNDDVMAWREKIKALLNDPQKRQAIAKAGQEKFKTMHRPERAITSYLQAYETALRIKI